MKAFLFGIKCATECYNRKRATEVQCLLSEDYLYYGTIEKLRGVKSYTSANPGIETWMVPTSLFGCWVAGTTSAARSSDVIDHPPKFPRNVSTSFGVFLLPTLGRRCNFLRLSASCFCLFHLHTLDVFFIILELTIDRLLDQAYYVDKCLRVS